MYLVGQACQAMYTTSEKRSTDRDRYTNRCPIKSPYDNFNARCGIQYSTPDEYGVSRELGGKITIRGGFNDEA